MLNLYRTSTSVTSYIRMSVKRFYERWNNRGQITRRFQILHLCTFELIYACNCFENLSVADFQLFQIQSRVFSFSAVTSVKGQGKGFRATGSALRQILTVCPYPAIVDASRSRSLSQTPALYVHRRVIIVDASNCSQKLGKQFEFCVSERE